MLNDIIAKFSENKQINSFDFSLRPTHDIDNPYTKISLNILDHLYEVVEKANKNVLNQVILDEAEENINFSYKIYSQITDMTPHDEGMLFKARIIELLNDLDDASSDAYAELIEFAFMLTGLSKKMIENKKLENAFIISMLLFETAEEMKIRNVHLNYILDFKNFLVKQKYILHLIAVKIFEQNNGKLKDLFVKEILNFINKFYNDANNKLCFDLLFFTALVADEKTVPVIKSALTAIKKFATHISVTPYIVYVKAGIAFSQSSPKEAVEYAKNKLKYHHGIEIFANTLFLTNNEELDADFLEHVISSRKLPAIYSLTYNNLLLYIYHSTNNKEKLAYTAKALFLLGDITAYYEAVDTLKELGKYEQEKQEIHDLACKTIPLYDYCTMLADSKEYDLLVNRFELIKSTRDIKEAIKFMDDQGVALYDNNTNKQLLEILSNKSGKYPKLQNHVKSLLELIMI